MKTKEKILEEIYKSLIQYLDWNVDCEKEIKAFICQAIDEAREETIDNLNVGFLRQWLNEDKITNKELVTDEQIMSFIKPYNK